MSNSVLVQRPEYVRIHTIAIFKIIKPIMIKELKNDFTVKQVLFIMCSLRIGILNFQY